MQRNHIDLLIWTLCGFLSVTLSVCLGVWRGGVGGVLGGLDGLGGLGGLSLGLVLLLDGGVLVAQAGPAALAGRPQHEVHEQVG